MFCHTTVFNGFSGFNTLNLHLIYNENIMKENSTWEIITKNAIGISF